MRVGSAIVSAKSGARSSANLSVFLVCMCLQSLKCLGVLTPVSLLLATFKHITVHLGRASSKDRGLCPHRLTTPFTCGPHSSAAWSAALSATALCCLMVLTLELIFCLKLLLFRFVLLHVRFVVAAFVLFCSVLFCFVIVVVSRCYALAMFLFRCR